MALTVNTNMAAMAAANTLNNTQGALSNTLARVSSGLRVTKAADDAAGQAVATNLSAQARSGKQAHWNANDGISVIQTAEAASKEVISILDRMRELAVQSSSETLEDGERAYIDSEFEQLSEEVERIAQSTEFNGISLSAGGATSQLAVQVGVDASSNSRVTIELGDLTASNLGVDTGTSGVDLSKASKAQSAITTIDSAIDSVNSTVHPTVRLRTASNSINNMSSYVESLQQQPARFRMQTTPMRLPR